MKKLLIVLLTILVLVACGSKETETVQTDDQDDDTTEEQEVVEVKIDVEPIVEAGKVHFTGSTNLFNQASLMFTVEGSEGYKAQTKATVEDGEFETESFSKEGEPLPTGEYSLSISLSIPSTQEDSFVEQAGEEYENLTGKLMEESSIGGKIMKYETTFTIDEIEEDSQSEEDTEEQEELTSVEEIKKAIEYSGLGENDTLEDFTFENGEITAEIKIVDDTFTPEQMAVTRYSQVSDYLLNFKGWEILSIEYVGVGEISFNREQAETNELGMEYFPILEIEKQINNL